MTSVYSLRRDITIETLWEELKDCFRSLLLKAIAVHDKDKVWKNALVTGLLTCERPERLRKEVEREFSDLVKLGVTELNDLVILYDVLDSEEFLNIIHELQGGGITISNQHIELRDPAEGTKVTSYTYFKYRDLYEYPGISVRIASRVPPRTLGILNGIDEKLKSLGYFAIDDVGLQWLGVKNFSTLSVEAEIAIPIYLSNTRLEFNQAEGLIMFRAKVNKALLPKRFCSILST